jgi:nucleoside-diphosphate-sugar epimerase
LKKKYKIILTGGEGLIGNALRFFLNEKKERVVLVDTIQKKHVLKYSLESTINLEDLNESLVNDYSSSIFIHAAGIANVALCEDKPYLAEATNIKLTSSCLEMALAQGCEKFIFFSTGFIYGDQSKIPHDETASTSITNCYLDTKFKAEKFVEDFTRKNNINGVILRLGNVYSKKSSVETVIGRIFFQLNKGGKTIELFSTKPVRDFLYIDDLCYAVYKVIRADIEKDCQVYNLSNGVGVSIQKIINLLQELNYPIDVKELRPNMAESILILKTDKFKNRFKWKPRFDIRSGILEIISK